MLLNLFLITFLLTVYYRQNFNWYTFITTTLDA
nr:MAG TPA: hypothetical protein [Caudoviricetes sp.]DAS06643.1 MAG TPA: hypothetical protein [Caudoviricetes sp.]